MLNKYDNFSNLPLSNRLDWVQFIDLLAYTFRAESLITFQFEGIIIILLLSSFSVFILSVYSETKYVWIYLKNYFLE